MNKIRQDATLRTYALLRQVNAQSGKIGWVILWLLGIPLPVLLIAYLIWGR